MSHVSPAALLAQYVCEELSIRVVEFDGDNEDERIPYHQGLCFEYGEAVDTMFLYIGGGPNNWLFSFENEEDGGCTFSYNLHMRDVYEPMLARYDSTLTFPPELSQLFFADGHMGYVYACRVARACAEMDGAATIIQRAWKEAIGNPSYEMCRMRLSREYNEMME